MNKKLNTLLISILIVGQSLAQDFNRAKMDSLLARFAEFDRGMGTLSLSTDTGEVYSYSIGYSDLAEGRKANHDTKYRIGSITKMFTATIIMKLVDQGELSLEDTLSKFYPSIPNAGKISIEDLLRHRSGIYNMTQDSTYENWMESQQSKEDLVNRISAYESQFEPGSKASYSNSGYVLLTFIAEDVYGKPYVEIMEEEICQPCQLKQTIYGGKIDPSQNEAFSYEAAGEWTLSRETDMSVPRGAGGIISTASDLNLFLKCLYMDSLVSEKSLEKMMKIKSSFGIGMITVPFYSRKAYGHTGGIDAFRSNSFYFPKDSLAVSYVSNGQRTPVNNLMIGVLSIYFGKDYTLPVYKESIQLKAEDLDQYLGVYATDKMPIKITITKKANTLYGQDSAQPSFPLEATAEHQFQFEAAGLTMTFNAEEGTMLFEQFGNKFEMKRSIIGAICMRWEPRHQRRSPGRLRRRPMTG